MRDLLSDLNDYGWSAN